MAARMPTISTTEGILAKGYEIARENGICKRHTFTRINTRWTHRPIRPKTGGRVKPRKSGPKDFQCADNLPFVSPLLLNSVFPKVCSHGITYSGLFNVHIRKY